MNEQDLKLLLVDLCIRKLLLVDLCARLPYKVKVKVPCLQEDIIFTLYSVNQDGFTIIKDNGSKFDIYNTIDIYPYLRPMSSMTDEEEKEYNKVVGYKGEADDGWTICDNIHTQYGIHVKGCGEMIDWLNAHHFDYRGLIEKGLALEAPEGMYVSE